MVELAARVLDTCERPAQYKDIERLMTILEVNQDNVAFACYPSRYNEAESHHQHPSHPFASPPLCLSTENTCPGLCAICYRTLFPKCERCNHHRRSGNFLSVYVPVYDVCFAAGQFLLEYDVSTKTSDVPFKLDVVYQKNRSCSDGAMVHLDAAWTVNTVHGKDIIFRRGADNDCLLLDIQGTWNTLLVLLQTLRNPVPKKLMHHHSINDNGFERDECLETLPQDDGSERNECLRYFRQRSMKHDDNMDADARAISLSPFGFQPRISYLCYWQSDGKGAVHNFLLTHHSVSNEAESREISRRLRDLSFLKIDSKYKTELREWDAHKYQAVRDVTTRDTSEFPLLSTIRSKLLERVRPDWDSVVELLREVTPLLQGIDDIREGVFRDWTWLQEPTKGTVFRNLAHELWLLKGCSDDVKQSVKVSLYGEAQRSAIAAYLRAWKHEFPVGRQLNALEYLSRPAIDRLRYYKLYSD